MPFGKAQKINVYLLLFFALVTAFVTITSVRMSAKESAEQLTEATGAELESLADEVARLLDREMFERLVDVELAVKHDTLRQSESSIKKKRQIMQQLKESNDHFAWLGYVNLDGTIKVGTDGLLEGMDVSKRDWFNGGKEGIYAGDLHAAVLLEPYLGKNSGGLPLRLVDVAAPVVDDEGNKIAVLGAHLDWRLAHDTVASVKQSVNQRQVDIFVLSHDGVVISGPKDMMFSQLNLPGVKAAGKGQTGNSIQDWGDGEYLTAHALTKGYKQFKSLNWVILVRESVDMAFSPVRQLTQKLILSGLLIGMIFLLVAMWLARWLSQPLVNITQAAHFSINDEKEIVLPESARYREVENLSHTLNTLLTKLIERQHALKEAHDNLEIKVEARTQELLQSEKMLRYVLDTIPARVFWKSRDGTYLGCNRLFAHDAGFEHPAQLIGKTDFDMPWQKQAELYRADDARVRESGQALLAYEEPQTRPDGKTIWVETSKIPITNSEDKVIGTLGVYQDITERKQAQMDLSQAHQRLEQQNQELIQTAQLREDVERITRHDLKNPLNAIIAVPSLLMHDGDLNEEQISLLKMVMNSGYRMLEMINASLDLYKMEIGSYEYHPENFDLNNVLQNVSNDMVTLLNMKSITLVLPDPAQQIVIYGESLLCHSLFSNLIKNAIEAAPSKTEVSVSATPCENGKCRIAVHNMGVVPEVMRSRFFDKYTTFGKNGGTGLGTYSAKLLTETQGGKINMSTSEQDGTSITVELKQGGDTKS